MINLKELTDEEFKELIKLKEGIRVQLESLEIVQSTIHLESRKLYYLNVDGEHIGKRLWEIRQLLQRLENFITKVERPLCPYCKARLVPNVASMADRFDPAMAIDYPLESYQADFGGYYCPKCKRAL